MLAGRRACLKRRSNAMQITRDRLGSIIGGTAVAAALAYFSITHQPSASLQQEQATLNIPTVEQMCAVLGATDPQSLMDCQALESSAGEYVIAWMGLNGFIQNGGIDLQQIQLTASLDDTNAVDPALTFDPTIDPGPAFDPSVDPGLDPSLDPLGGY